MAEIHSNFYFKHPDNTTQSLLHEMLAVFDLNSELKADSADDAELKFLEIAARVNPGPGEPLARKLLNGFFKTYGERFGSESIDEEHGYVVSHWVNGSSGFDIQVGLINFFYDICPDVHAQSWSCDDDEPCECWLKQEDGKIVGVDNLPYTQHDPRTVGTVYRWWHSEMPDGINEGCINDADYKEICEQIHEAVFISEEQAVSELEYNQWLNTLLHPKDTNEHDNSTLHPGNASSLSTPALSREEIFAYLSMKKRSDRNPLWHAWYSAKRLVTGRPY